MEYTVPSTTRRLMEWAAREGAQFPKLAYPVRFEPGYIGAMATSDLGPDEVILRVPEKLWLSWDKANAPPLDTIYTSYPDTFDSDVTRMCTFMAYELTKGPDSYWEPFLTFLKQDIETLLNWTDEEKRELQDSELAQEAVQSLEYVRNKWTDWHSAVQNYPHFFSPENLTFETYFWLTNVIKTRSFGKYADGHYVVPLADLINHDPKSLTSYMIGAPELRMHSFPLEDDYDYEPEESTHPRPPYLTEMVKLHYSEEENPVQEIVSRLPQPQEPEGRE